MTTIRTAFQQDHLRLDGLFEDLLNRMHVNDVAAAREVWTAFDAGLAGHLEAEESFMIPIFQRHDPVEAAAILAEHAKIRSLVAELGMMLDIHALREDTVAELVRFLRAHAAREEAALYRWADTELPEAPKISLVERLDEARRAAIARVKKLAGELGSTVL
jgi:hemerythrin